MKHSEFLVMKGEPRCLFRGFERLRGAASGKVVELSIQTAEYEKKRKFKLISVDQYDPNLPTNLAYEKLGQFWVDIVTGTLYHPVTGECQSSTQIRLVI